MPPTRAARWTTSSGRSVGRTGLVGGVAVGEVVLGAAGDARPRRPRSASVATTTRPRKPDPPVTMTRRPSQQGRGVASSRVRGSRTAMLRRATVGRWSGRPVRRWPTPSSSAGTACPAARRWPPSRWPRALATARDVDVVGVARPAIGRPPPAAVRPTGLPVRHAAAAAARCSTRRGTGCGRPRVERRHRARSTSCTPPRSSSRRRSAPLVVTVHDLAFLHEPDHFTRRGRAVLPPGPRARAPRRRPRAVLVDGDDGRLRGARHRPPTACASSRSGVDVPPAATPTTVAEVRRRYGLDRPYVAVRRHDRAPQEPAPPARGRSRRLPEPTTSSSWSDRRAGDRR